MPTRPKRPSDGLVRVTSNRAERPIYSVRIKRHYAWVVAAQTATREDARLIAERIRRCVDDGVRICADDSAFRVRCRTVQIDDPVCMYQACLMISGDNQWRVLFQSPDPFAIVNGCDDVAAFIEHVIREHIEKGVCCGEKAE